MLFKEMITVNSENQTKLIMHSVDKMQRYVAKSLQTLIIELWIQRIICFGKQLII
jgi:hypothetical protein